MGRLVGQDEHFHRHLASPAVNATGRAGCTGPEMSLAVEMAKAEQKAGHYPDVVALAGHTEIAQAKEIATMQGLFD